MIRYLFLPSNYYACSVCNLEHWHVLDLFPIPSTYSHLLVDDVTCILYDMV